MCAGPMVFWRRLPCLFAGQPSRSYSIHMQQMIMLFILLYTEQIVFWSCDILTVVFITILITKLFADQRGVQFEDVHFEGIGMHVFYVCKYIIIYRRMSFHCTD